MAKTEDKKTTAGRRRTKDHVFTDLFDQKEYQLELYRTLHPKDRKIKESDLETLTLETVLNRGIYNDLGFLAKDKVLLLVEAQSSFSEYILFRAFMYLAKSYQKYTRDRKINLYGTKKVKMPAPELYMIYSGEKGEHPEELSLRKTFFRGIKCDIEVKIKIIYADGSHSIIDQYIQFCRVLDQQRKLYPDDPKKALQETIRICKDRDLLKKYLEQHETEVIDMMDALYSQKEINELAREEARAEGEAIGVKKGKAEGAFSTLAKLLKSKKITKSDAADSLGMSVAEFNKMYKELGLSNC